MQLNRASADPISNFSFVPGTTNCSSGLFPSDFESTVLDCQEFDVFSNGVRLLTGLIHRELGEWDSDPNSNGPGQSGAGMPPGVCQDSFDACYSYPKVIERLTSMLNSPNATDLFNGDNFDGSNIYGSCGNYLGVACLATTRLYGLSDEGCLNYKGIQSASDPNGYFYQCWRSTTQQLKEAYGAKQLGLIFGIGVPLFLLLACGGPRLKKYLARKKEERKTHAEQAAIMNTHMSQLIAARFLMRTININSGNLDLSQPITGKILDFSCENPRLKTQVVAEAKNFDEKRHLHRQQLNAARILMIVKFKNNRISASLDNQVILNILSFLFYDGQDQARHIQLNRQVIGEVNKVLPRPRYIQLNRQVISEVNKVLPRLLEAQNKTQKPAMLSLDISNIEHPLTLAESSRTTQANMVMIDIKDEKKLESSESNEPVSNQNLFLPRFHTSNAPSAPRLEIAVVKEERKRKTIS